MRILLALLFSFSLYAEKPITDDVRPSAEDLRLRDFLMERKLQVAPSPQLVQPVVFHVIYQKNGEGKIPFMRLHEQIEQLNKAVSGDEARAAKYANTTDLGVRFDLHAVKYLENDEFFNLCALPSIISKYRSGVMLDPARYLNTYVCWAQNQLGISWLPYQSWFRQPTGENHYALGIILHWALVGKNTWSRTGGQWFQGDIMTHELGHHYGLMHPYEGDCFGTEANSDNIADTPRQTGNPFAGCEKKGKVDSCPKMPGKDDIQNYMGAYRDTCRSHFTPGQVKFMRDTIATYKPTLVKQLPVDCVTAVDSTDTAPDLFPCVGGVIRNNQRDGRPWCYISAEKTNWGYACCPVAGSRNGENNCRIYDPSKVNVSVKMNGVDLGLAEKTKLPIGQVVDKGTQEP